ncbi:HDL225Cp [Eremothecium sinecaudum]|uniref:HDL225Cp n=1 Tax=Eremothecium sinecaudum TaxID=45286 RepID=A0A0X8HS78_9SACH|nr:HDL225Cp [Eremothecium sinecaudum]AMD20519.1 HDL225Cp [Eremothecium sinecaudum]
MVSKGLLGSIRFSLTAFYLFLVLITVPISFQVGGLYCGLSFTVTLFNLYFITATLKITLGTRSRTVRLVTSLVYYLQHFLIPSILFLFLSGFSYNQLQRKLVGADEMFKSKNMLVFDSNVNETLVQLLGRVQNDGSDITFYYYYRYCVVPWQYMLLHATPYFSLAEGFFTVLAIQAIGETGRWLKFKKNSNTWVILSLMVSGVLITTSMYYLYRIYVTPIWPLSVQTATLLGFTLSLVFGLGLYGIISGKGSAIESSLFFAYMVRCIYEISPKLALTAMSEIFQIVHNSWQLQQGNLSRNNLLTYFKGFRLNTELIWNTLQRKLLSNKHPVETVAHRSPSLSILVEKTARLLQQQWWLKWQQLWSFIMNVFVGVSRPIHEILVVTLKMAKESMNPAVITNLGFRVLVFYSATRIIPAIQMSTGGTQSRKLMKIIYWYSPCIVIAMYTHLILRYSGELNNDLCIWGCIPWINSNRTGDKWIVDAWSFWNWCNLFFTILIYAVELICSR